MNDKAGISTEIFEDAKIHDAAKIYMIEKIEHSEIATVCSTSMATHSGTCLGWVHARENELCGTSCLLI